jgi:UDP-N-acetylmuramoyl-tripeptide--D-alanyl-D-alanine ligase
MSLQLSLNELARVVGCQPPSGDVFVSGAVIDTRQISTGNLFVALKGERVDGHDFIKQAREAGASAALVSKLQNDPLPQMQVANVRRAFAQIAKYWRQQCQARVVAITGSNGKTSVKEMVSAILKQVGTVTATQGNLNNDLGVPLTLCRLGRYDDFAVIEMGANHPGEIAGLVAVAEPDVAIINNVAPAHLEGFGSVEGVAAAKGEIFAGLPAQGVGVINADMPHVELWQSLLASRQFKTFALENPADITAEYVQLDLGSSHFMVAIDGVSHHFNLPLPGMHNVANALAAIAICVALEIPVAAMVKGLSSIQAVPHRLQLRAGIGESRIIDDTYNANPGSYLQALKTLSGFSGQHWLVLGDFGELGSKTEEIHQQMGLQAREAGVDRLLTVGTSSRSAANSFGEGAEHYEDIETLQNLLQNELSKEVTCLIKGSRFMQLDKLADELAERGAR